MTRRKTLTVRDETVSELLQEHLAPRKEGRNLVLWEKLSFSFAFQKYFFLRDNALISSHQSQFFLMGYQYVMTSNPGHFAKDPSRVRRTASCYTHGLSFGGASRGLLVLRSARDTCGACLAMTPQARLYSPSRHLGKRWGCTGPHFSFYNGQKTTGKQLDGKGAHRVQRLEKDRCVHLDSPGGPARS